MSLESQIIFVFICMLGYNLYTTDTTRFFVLRISDFFSYYDYIVFINVC